jgi:hypothetical protein
VTIATCDVCSSSNLVEVIAETCIHFPGLNGLKADPTFVFPKAVVCLDCGFARSNLSWRDLEQVRKGTAKVKVKEALLIRLNSGFAPTRTCVPFSS